MANLGFKNSRRRTSFCVCSGCVWLLVLVIVLQCVGAEENTAVVLENDGQVNYTSPNLNLNYNSSTTVNAKAMEQLYYVTNFFIDIIQSEDAYPEGLLEDENGRFSTTKLTSDWSLLARHYAGVVSVAAVGILFAVLMPLVGLIFCCCRCAGRCGARNQPFERKRDPCRRVSFGIILSGVAIIILFGVVCAFVTNEYMEDGIKTLPSKLNVALSDVHLYMDNTVLHLTTLLETNFQQLRGSIADDLALASTTLTSQLMDISQLSILDTMVHFSDGLKEIQTDIDTAHNLSEELKNDATAVNNTLNEIQDNLSRLLKKCLTAQPCQNALEQVENTKTPADFTNFLDRYLPKLPDITEELSDFNKVDEIQKGIDNGMEEFRKVKRRINESLADNIPTILDNIDNAGDAVKKQSDNITTMVNNLTVSVDTEVKPHVKDLDDYITEYAQYRYYVDISVCAVMLLVLLSITLGLFCGFCGKRPDSGYDNDCCNKATGSSFLMLAVYVMFFFSMILMLVTLVHFLLGVFVEKAVCQSLQHPDNSQLLTMANKELDLKYTVNGSVVHVNITGVISSCHANQSLYKVLQLWDVINIEEILDYPKRYNIDETIHNLKDEINISMDVTLMDSTTKADLIKLSNSSLDLKSFDEVLSSVGESSQLTDLANTLEETAGKDEITDDTIKKSLKEQADQLRDLQENGVQGIIVKAGKLNDTLHSLDEKLKFNHSSLHEAVHHILAEVEIAENYLKSSASNQDMIKLIDVFANSTLDKVNAYLNHVVIYTTTVVGYCEPLSRVYNASLVATCNDILDPFNGFWASIGWCLVLFIPAIILSVKLASLYRKSEAYHAAGIPDTEYLYDAYADRDNIPLANGPDKKNHHRRYNETYDNSSGYMGDYNSHRDRRERGGPAYHSEDARFNDMAPKYTPLGHWDYSNGAVPRYHSPPLSTEYERPPPYYYPGPGDSGRR